MRYPPAQGQTAATITGGYVASFNGATGDVSGVASFNGRTGSVAPESGDYTAADVSAVATSAVGAASGVASLDASGNVPAAQLGNQAVKSVFARTGAVAAASGDYSASQVTGALSTGASGVVTELTTTGATSIATLTPGATGEYVVFLYLFTTAATTLTATLTWTDPTAGGSESSNFFNVAGTSINALSITGEANCTPMVIAADIGHAVTVTVTAGTAAQAYATAAIVKAA